LKTGVQKLSTCHVNTYFKFCEG